MRYYTLNTNEQELAHLHMVYGDHLKPNNNKKLLFVASHNKTIITAHKDGKVVLEGPEVHNELLSIKTMLKREDYEAIGSSEVGTADVFGPVVFCAAYTTVEDIEFLEKLNIRDPKVVNDEYIAKIGPIIAKRLTHSLIILDPEKYNRSIEEGFNLNRMKARLHNQAIISLTAKLPNKDLPVIIDQFCTPRLYYNYLKDETLVYRDLQFHLNAEEIHISVVAASIIARYGYLYSMQQCSRIAGQTLLKGASKKVDEQLADIVDKNGVSILDEIAKTNFKNVTKQDF